MLSRRGYEVKLRGQIDVKGKGIMETFFVLGRKSGRAPGFTRQSSQYNNSLAAVVYALAQAKKKLTNNSGKF